MGILYLVATPIGNLEDISTRALRILGEVSLIAAEDTRHTGKLLAHFAIKTPLISYYEHNKLSRLDRILEALSQGDVALVSDAGTPTLNDPGYELVRAALQAGFNVSPIPGPSAPLAALVASGLPTDAFLYLGYLPRKTVERVKLCEEVANLPYTLIFLETPHRLLESLADMQRVLSDRQVCVSRELTKLYEEFFRGTLSQASEYFNLQPPRGELTLVVAGQRHGQVAWSEEEMQRAINEHLALGESPSEIASLLAQKSGWRKKQVYRMIVEGREE